MWMLLIVKLLSFKRYNYPFYKCRESGRQMQCTYSQSVSDKVVPLLFSLFCKILETNAMHCFSASSVSCVTERLSGCKDTDLYWIRANYYLKKDYSTVAFFDNFNRTTSCIFILHSSRYKCNPYFYYLSGSNSSIAQMACSSTFLM